jgi:hypothetical protein
VLQQAMRASAIAMPTRAYASAARSSVRSSARTTWVRIEIECPGGVGVLPGSSDQKRAIDSRSGVRRVVAA